MEKLSDLELHREFKRNNLPNIAVTETTRNIMFKKLTNKTSPNTNKQLPILCTDSSIRHNTVRKRTDTGASISNRQYMKETNSTMKSLRVAEKNINIAKASSSSGKQYQAFSEHLFNSTMPPVHKSEKNLTTANYDAEDDVKTLHYSPLNKFYRKDLSVDASPTAMLGSYKNQKTTFTSNFDVVKNLLRLSTTSNRNLKTTEKPNMGVLRRPTTLRQYNFTFFLRLLLAKMRAWLNGQPQNKPILIPYVLISILLIFFLVVGCLYIFLIPKSLLSRMNSIKYHMCSDLGTSADLKSTLHICIEENKFAEISQFSTEFADLLRKTSTKYNCINEIQSVQDGVISLTKFISKKEILFDIQSLLKLNFPLYIVKCKPELSISNENSKVISREEFEPNRISNFLLLKPQISFIDLLKYKLQRGFFIIGVVTLIAAIALSVYGIVILFQKRQIERANSIKQLSSDIINELKYRATLCDNGTNSEVEVNQLRDQIIPFNKRSKLLKLWNETLGLLESCDHRIQFRVSLCNGEEYCTIKWIGDINTNQADQRDFKKWQSPAFKNLNKIESPPTECLKIRNMFDSTEITLATLKQDIVNAILTKVGLSVNICDIQLDTKSCCVYVRCASAKDAGIIHNELNGWWFDNRLVSIKFLRLQRYLSRFPTSPAKISGTFVKC